LKQVPDGCTVIAYDPDFDLGFRAPGHLSVTLGRTHVWHMGVEVPEEVMRRRCVVYAQMSSCLIQTDVPADAVGQEGMCRDVLGRAVTPIATEIIPAAAAGGHRYLTREVGIGLYWIRKP
jgi:hypothetical protein